MESNHEPPAYESSFVLLVAFTRRLHYHLCYEGCMCCFNPVLLCRWYVSRTFRVDKHVDGCKAQETKVRFDPKRKLALCEMTIERAGAGECILADGQVFELFDVERQRVAKVLLVASSTKPFLSKEPLKAPAAESGHQWLEKVRSLHQSNASLRDTNVTEIQKFIFGKVNTPYGTLPSWVFSWLAARRARAVTQSHAQVLELLFANACYFVHLDPSQFETAPIDTQLEIMCEVSTMAPRFLVYVRDVSLRLGHDHLVDDWTRIPDAPVPALIAYDCEDGSEEVLAQSIALNATPALTGSLRQLQRLERRYCSCFCVVTLRLGSADDWIYHAIVMKFDRRWMQKKLGLPIDEPETAPLLPPLLLESTAYTTSNWRYRTPHCTTKTFEVAEAHIEANTKICAELIVEQNKYGHLISFTCPELTENNEIAQVECAFKHKHGIPIKTLMLQPENTDIELIACKVDRAQIQHATNEAQLFPETKMLRLEGKSVAPKRTSTRPPKTQFLVRGPDLEDPENLERVKAVAAGMGKVTWDPIYVYGGISGVNVVIE